MLGLLDNKKKIGAVIVKKMLGSPMSDIHESSENLQDFDPALKSAAEKMMSAIHMRDISKFLEGLKEFHTIHEEQLEKEEESEEEGESEEY
jgi:hypothetical protein